MVEFSSKIIPDEWLGHFDMLRDQRRNSTYSRQIQLFKMTRNKEEEEEYWIDIGCGSGLLGCLIGKYLQMKVIAFECVPLLAKIARQTIQRNNLQDYVMVWLVHTTDLDSQFMERTFGRKASYVVSELLDTTLLGEGLFEGLIHAYSHLIKPHQLTRRITSVPHLARVFVQAWGGECISDRRNLSEKSLTRFGLSSCSEVNRCLPSSASTVQWSYFRKHGAIPLTTPAEIFDFDFSNLSTRLRAQVSVSLSPLNSSIFPLEVNAIVLFWGCCCCTNSIENSLCCSSMDSVAVFHTKGDTDETITDHWRQSVFFLNSNEVRFDRSTDILNLQCSHNEDDLWIQNLEMMSSGVALAECPSLVTANHCPYPQIIRPICQCGFHSSYSSFQIREMNSRHTSDWILEVTTIVNKFLKNLLQTPSFCGFIFIITDDLLCPNAIAKHLETALTSDVYLSPPRLKFVILCTSKSALNASKLFFNSNCRNGSMKEIVEFREFGHPPIDEDEHEVDIDQSQTVNCDLIGLEGFLDLISSFKQKMECYGIDEMIICPLSGLPYLSDLHDEGTFHHLLSLYHLHQRIFQECQQRMLIPREVSFRFDDECSVTLCCGLFTSDSLWRQYTGEIEMVEGVDMSAINILMNDIPKQFGDMKCVRLSQWNAEDLRSVTSFGTIDSFLLRTANQCELWEGKTTLIVCENGIYHGVAVFTILQHVKGSCLLTTHPLDCPDSFQHFRCFGRESSLETGTKLEISIKLTHDHRFLISVQ
jgi:hypothetical protein